MESVHQDLELVPEAREAGSGQSRVRPPAGMFLGRMRKDGGKVVCAHLRAPDEGDLEDARVTLPWMVHATGAPRSHF